MFDRCHPRREGMLKGNALRDMAGDGHAESFRLDDERVERLAADAGKDLGDRIPVAAVFSHRIARQLRRRCRLPREWRRREDGAWSDDHSTFDAMQRASMMRFGVHAADHRHAVERKELQRQLGERGTATDGAQVRVRIAKPRHEVLPAAVDHSRAGRCAHGRRGTDRGDDPLAHDHRLVFESTITVHRDDRDINERDGRLARLSRGSSWCADRQRDARPSKCSPHARERTDRGPTPIEVSCSGPHSRPEPNKYRHAASKTIEPSPRRGVVPSSKTLGWACTYVPVACIASVSSLWVAPNVVSVASSTDRTDPNDCIPSAAQFGSMDVNGSRACRKPKYRLMGVAPSCIHGATWPLYPSAGAPNITTRGT